MVHRTILTLASLLILLAPVLAEYTLSDFKTKLFKFNYPENGLYNVELGFGEDDILPLAFGDLNNDKYTDIVSTNTKRDILTFYIYSRAKGQFLKDQIRPFVFPKNIYVDGAILLSWNGVSKPDLLVTTTKDGQTEMGIYSQDGNSSYTLEQYRVPLMLGTQPFVADINGDFYLDILFTSPEGERNVVLGGPNSSLETQTSFDTFMDKSLECIIPDRILPFSKPHSAAFLDLNGDCLSDLFFTSSEGSRKFHEVWLRTQRPGEKNVKYCLRFFKEVDASSSQVTFTDFDRDGQVDFLYVANGKVLVEMNKLPSSAVGEEDCLRPTFAQEASMFYAGGVENPEISIKLPKEFKTLYGTATYPPVVRVNDYNMDGYPDLLITWKNTTGKQQAFLCESENDRLGDFDSCGLLAENIELATFFDLDEDGYIFHTNNKQNRRIDILTVEKKNNKHIMKGYYQYFNRDSFFLKVLQVQNENYGGLYYGTEFTYTYTDLDGKRHVGVGIQAPQNSHSALQLPYGLVGIGRSSNYIEHLHISYPVTIHPNSRVWSPIIPNSQIIIKPHMSDSNNWKIELFVNPSSKLSFIIVIVALLLIVLVFFISVLYYKEKV